MNNKELDFKNRVIALQSDLLRFAMGFTSNMDDAKDLLQETYLKAIINQEKFSPSTNLAAWLYTIMKNTYINDYRRKEKVREKVDSSDHSYASASMKQSEGQSPDDEYSVNEIRQNIKGLNDELRIPFEMYISGHKYREIAKSRNLSIGTVKSRIFFARKKLKQKVKMVA